MANISEAEALTILPLATMRMELRIPDDSHDELVTGQIVAAVNFVSVATDRGAGALLNPALRSGAILLCRQLYDGDREIRPTASFWALIDPFRRLYGEFTDPSIELAMGDHTRYFGWSDDRVIDTADFSTAATSSSNVGSLPQRATNGYIWFAVPEAAGYPASLHIDNGPIDQIAVYVQQAGTMDDLNGQPHLVGVSFDIQTLRLSGQEIELGN